MGMIDFPSPSLTLIAPTILLTLDTGRLEYIPGFPGEAFHPYYPVQHLYETLMINRLPL